MKWSVLHSGCVDGGSGSTQTRKLILRRLGMKRTKVMEKLKVRGSGRRCFSTRNLLQTYGLKVSLVNPTLRLGSPKVSSMVQVKLGILQGYEMFRVKNCSMNGPNSSLFFSFGNFPQNIFWVINYSRRAWVQMRFGTDPFLSRISNSKCREAKIL